MLELNKVNHGFNQVTLLRDVSYSFYRGKSYAIMGPSGSGKSTLLHILAGLEKPQTGAVLCEGQDLRTLSQEQYLLNTIGLMFQQAYLVPELTVIENVMLKGIIASGPSHMHRVRGHQLLEQCGIASLADARPQHLSGGEQQRVALARALFVLPQFLLADEPTAHLDEQTAQEIMHLIYEEQRVTGCGLIITTHNPTLAQQCDYRLTLSAGTLHAS